jgi:hypothetical protein
VPASLACRSRSAFFTPSLTTLPSRSIVFFAGGGNWIPHVSFITPLTLQGSDYAKAVDELNKAVERAEGLLWR